MLAYLGLGSNLGDRLSNLQAAVNFLDLRAGRVLRVSSVYETEPMYVVDQPSFLNAAAELSTDLHPERLLETVKAIEAEIGRQPRERYGPREVDIDLLVMLDCENSVVHVQSDRLTLPHPHIAERVFVLQPLSELGDIPINAAGDTAHSALNLCSKEFSVRRHEDGVLSIHSD